MLLKLVNNFKIFKIYQLFKTYLNLFSKDLLNQMKISIITVTYNAAEFLDTCIKSVQQQTHPDIEYLIIDGHSTDNTLNIARSYGFVSQIVSEKDRGMYDALNKGIALATGDVIGVLHADDFFASNRVLSNVANAFLLSMADVLYGDLWYVNKEDTTKTVRKWVSKPYQPGLFQWGWMPPHPTFFVKRELFDKYGKYRLDMGTAADYELMMRFLHQQSAKSFYLPEVMVKMRVGGLSNSSLANRLKANQADLRALKINGIKYPRLAAFLKPVRKIPQFLGL